MPNQPRPDAPGPLSFRPGVLPGDPEGDREWLQAEHRRTGESVSGLVSLAVAELRARREGRTECQERK